MMGRGGEANRGQNVGVHEHRGQRPSSSYNCSRLKVSPAGQGPGSWGGRISSIEKVRRRLAATSPSGPFPGRSNTSVSASRSTSRVFQPATCQASAWLWPPLRFWFDHQGRYSRAESGSSKPRIVSISPREQSARKAYQPTSEVGYGVGDRTFESCRVRRIHPESEISGPHSRISSTPTSRPRSRQALSAVRAGNPSSCARARQARSPTDNPAGRVAARRTELAIA